MDKNSSIVRVECPMVSIVNLAAAFAPATVFAPARLSPAAVVSAAAEEFVFAGAARLPVALAALVLFLGVTTAPKLGELCAI